MNNSSAKFQSTENTEQTESLADVGHVAVDFVLSGACRMKKHQEGLRLLGGCESASRGRKMSCENSLRKTKKMNNSSAKKSLAVSN